MIKWKKEHIKNIYSHDFIDILKQKWVLLIIESLKIYKDN